ncbi:MAG: PLP-dependent aspartate aminotransferase family protein [Lachnospiraceae bacterium]|nr:PLP-dependent aspartate aminotransferase family protein [Lachnospiraceae bacterium]
MSTEFATRCIHIPEERSLKDRYGAMTYPIYQTATFAHPGVGQSTGYDYSRSGNPTRDQVERIVASLEGAADALGFSTGMAAIALLMEIFRPGDHLVIDSDLYGGSTRLFSRIGEKNGLRFTKVNCSLNEVEAAILPETKAVFLETPSNPTMRITDLTSVSEVAKRRGLLLIVDNTFLSPYFQNPLELGADVVVHSGTKYLGGHNDTLAGFLAVKDPELAAQLRFLQKTTGATLAPFDSFLIARGIKTLPLRMRQAQENALAIADWLQGRPEVTKVYYPGLPTHPGHEILKSQARGFGAMISFETETKEFALRVLEEIRLISYAESLGGVETLLTYPLTQTHADVPEEERLKNGITDRLLRMSVGVEDVRDLIADLEQAFAAAGEKTKG